MNLKELEDTFREGVMPEYWTVKARVIAKQPLSWWKDVDGQVGGKRLNFSIVDKTGTEADCVSFNENAEYFDPLLANDQVYYISNAYVTESPVSDNLSLKFYRKSTFVEPCHTTSDVNEIPRTSDRMLLKDLAYVEECEPEQLIDVLAVIADVSLIEEISSAKKAGPIIKRDIVLCDKTTSLVRCTLWEEKAKEIDESTLGKVVLFHDILVKEIQNKLILSAGQNSYMVLNPRIKEAYELKKWFKASPVSGARALLDRRDQSKLPVLTFGSDKLKCFDQELVFQLKSCSILEVDDPRSYKACRRCKRKVDENRGYYCENCIECEEPEERIWTRMTVFDGDEMRKVTIFHEKLMYLFHISPERLTYIHQKGPQMFNEICDSLIKKRFKMTIKASMDSNKRVTFIMWNAKQIQSD